jgi:hypothetical protein
VRASQHMFLRFSIARRLRHVQLYRFCVTIEWKKRGNRTAEADISHAAGPSAHTSVQTENGHHALVARHCEACQCDHNIGRQGSIADRTAAADAHQHCNLLCRAERLSQRLE